MLAINNNLHTTAGSSFRKRLFLINVYLFIYGLLGAFFAYLTDYYGSENVGIAINLKHCQRNIQFYTLYRSIVSNIELKLTVTLTVHWQT